MVEAKNLVEVAALVGDTTRAAMPHALMGGQALTAKELGSSIAAHPDLVVVASPGLAKTGPAAFLGIESARAALGAARSSVNRAFVLSILRADGAGPWLP